MCLSLEAKCQISTELDKNEGSRESSRDVWCWCKNIFKCCLSSQLRLLQHLLIPPSNKLIFSNVVNLTEIEVALFYEVEWLHLSRSLLCHNALVVNLAHIHNPVLEFHHSNTYINWKRNLSRISLKSILYKSPYISVYKIFILLDQI